MVGHNETASLLPSFKREEVDALSLPRIESWVEAVADAAERLHAEFAAAFVNAGCPSFCARLDPRDYSVLEDGQRIGRIRYAEERIPGIWLWHVQVHIPGLAPQGTAKDLDAAKVQFKAAWEAFKAKHGPERLSEAYKAMNTRDRD